MQDALNAMIDAATSIFNVKPLQVFAKILTPNDDSGRHGVLIPSEAYGFFPDLPTPDPSQNETVLIQGLDVTSRAAKQLGWKYYQRYPERRITRLHGDFNRRSDGLRLAVFVKVRCIDGTVAYLFEIRLEKRDEDFWHLARELFAEAPLTEGAFIQRPFGQAFREDGVLTELIAHYDRISALGWIDTLRRGDTGIGYTFEELVGIKENNDQNADFKGIEIKCKLKKQKGRAASKTNLFQLAPTWAKKSRGIDRLRAIGCADVSGKYSCYSQVTVAPNNLGLNLHVQVPPLDIDLLRHGAKLGHWTRARLWERLAMKHSRAAFIKAESRLHGGTVQYRYNEFVYCELPDIERFVDMVSARKIVFEFTMSEPSPGKVRNHGYPWRIIDDRELDLLFGLQIRLRGED
ncbi:MAG TPA: MvaI/BcnI family restriction endonuclease [Lysobacter sp.]